MGELLDWLKRKLSAERLAATALLLALSVLRILDPAPVEVLRLKTLDLMQQLRPRTMPADPPVLIVDIGEDSLKKYGQWPWPRTLLAELVDKIKAAGGKAIAFDILFSEPDRLSGAALAKALPQADDETRDRLRGLASGDAVLARAMSALPTVVGAAGYEKPLGTKPPARAGQFALLGQRPEPFLYSYPGLLLPMPELEAAAAGIGLVSVQPERDGTVRRVPTAMIAEGAVLPSLDIELLRVANGGQSVIVRSDNAGVASVTAAGHVLPTDNNGQVWINFSPHDRARYVSAADVLEGAVPPDRLKDKLVLVGSSAVALFDLRTTPLDRLIPGVEIHAQLIENVLGDALLSRPNFAIAIELFVTLAFGALVIALVPVLGAVPVFAMGGIATLLFVASAWLLYAYERIVIDLSYPLLATGAIYTVLTYFNYWREEARRTQIRGAFSQYVAPALVDRLVSQPDKLKLGGETREMTILFSDVRGFTSISERYKRDPEGLVALMNGMLTPLSHAILDTGGTIDKYMGDAILAFWNAPLDDPDHAGNACLAALDMRRRLDGFNAERKRAAEAHGIPHQPIEIGVGLNTGHCVVGNFGSDMRFDYSVIGDCVNIASRLEALTGAYGLGILIGSATAERAGKVVATLPVDRVRVKGKTEPETLHAVLGPKAIEDEPWFAPLKARLAEMHAAYTAADWANARARLAVCEKADSEKRLAGLFKLYARRIDDFASRPEPPKNWDGAISLTGKDG